MTARFIVADVMDGLASLETGSVDLVVTSPPFLALRSYLPADHADKGKEIGSESTPAEFIDTLLKVTAELRRVLAPHGSICVELGDTYAGSTMSGGDDRGNERYPEGRSQAQLNGGAKRTADTGWPLAKSRTLIPSLYQIALAYGFNPLTGTQSPAGQWRVRNIVTWARPNPPVGALGDKWRPATSDLVVACTSGKRYWDDLATRRPFAESTIEREKGPPRPIWREGRLDNTAPLTSASASMTQSGAPLLDYWVIPPGGYAGAHYAVFPEELVVPCVQAMCPQRVCVTCGQPSRRIVDVSYEAIGNGSRDSNYATGSEAQRAPTGHYGDGYTNSPDAMRLGAATRQATTLGWSDCGHNNWRPGLILDPFAGSGTTLAVATGHGHDAIGIDLDRRNVALARDRIGPLLFEEVDIGELQPGSSG